MRHFGTYKPGGEADDVARSLMALREEVRAYRDGASPMGGSCWPDANQTLLLKVLFEQPDAASDAWQTWRNDNDPEYMDVPSMRLVPQLHRRLRQLGIDDPWMPKFKGSYRKTWTNNQRMILHALPAIALLGRSRVPVVALKGLAITLQYLGADFGLRSMFDCDVLVLTQDAPRAIDLLLANGWQFNSSRSIEHLKQKILPKENGREFVKDLGHIDLHWHMLHQDPSEWMDRWAWKGVRTTDFRGHRLSVPSPTALLVNVCLHGVKFCATPSIMWAADALTITRAAQSEIDWPAIVQLARERSLALPLIDSLSYLVTVESSAVPFATLEDLRSIPISPVEQIEYQAIVASPSTRSWAGHAAMSYLVALRQRHAIVDPMAQLASHEAWALKAAGAANQGVLSRSCAIRSRW